MKRLLLLSVVLNGFLTSAQLPVHQWSKSFGGEGNETIGNTVVDTQGNVFTCGIFNGTKDFDPSVNVANLTASGSNFDVFISKLNSAGEYQWAYKFGAFFPEEYCNLTLDSNGNIYLAGSLAGTVDFDPGAGVENLSNTSGSFPNTFILKLNNNGTFGWVKKFAGGENYPTFIKTDNEGNLIISGNYGPGTVDFDPSAAISNSTLQGTYFVKLTNNGDFVWAKSMEDYFRIKVYDLQTDANSNIYTLGTFSNTVDFDSSAATFNVSAQFNKDLFVLKTNGLGELLWIKNMACDDVLYPESLAIDSNNNIFLAGSFKGVADFDPSEAVVNLTSNYDTVYGYQKHTFVEKLDSNGNYLWVNRTGQLINEFSSGYDPNYNAGFIQSGEMVLDNLGNVLLSGMFQGNMTFGNINITSALCQNCANSQYPKSTDMFLTKIDTNGNNLWVQNYSTYRQNVINSIELFDLTVDPSSNLYLHGYSFFSVDFDSSVAGNELDPNAQRIFVTKFGIQTLATNQSIFTNNLQLYPNPSSGNFHLDISEELLGAKVSVYNILGQNIKQFSLEGLTTNQNLNKGIYILEIEKDGNTTSRKLIVN